MLRTLVDQVCMSPIGLGTFFTFMTIAEGGGQKALKRKFTEVVGFRGELTIGISPCIEGELLCLADCADRQFQVYAIASANSICQSCGNILVSPRQGTLTAGMCISVWRILVLRFDAGMIASSFQGIYLRQTLVHTSILKEINWYL